MDSQRLSIMELQPRGGQDGGGVATTVWNDLQQYIQIVDQVDNNQYIPWISILAVATK